MTKRVSSITAMIAAVGVSACAGTATAELEGEKKETHRVEIIQEMEDGKTGEKKVSVSILSSDMDEPLVVDSLAELSDAESQAVIEKLKEKGIILDSTSGNLEIMRMGEDGEHRVVMLDNEAHGDIMVGDEGDHVYVLRGKADADVEVRKIIVSKSEDGDGDIVDEHVVVLKSEGMSEEELDKFLDKHGIEVDMDGDKIWVHDHDDLGESAGDGHVIILKEEKEVSKEEAK